MGIIDTVLDKLMFWRDDHDHEVEGCFTLPGAELDVPPIVGDADGESDQN